MVYLLSNPLIYLLIYQLNFLYPKGRFRW